MRDSWEVCRRDGGRSAWLLNRKSHLSALTSVVPMSLAISSPTAQRSITRGSKQAKAKIMLLNSNVVLGNR